MESVDEILRAILPEDLLDGTPSSFTITGHIGQFFLVLLR